MKKVAISLVTVLLLAACTGGGGGGAATPTTIPLDQMPHDVFIRGEIALGDLGVPLPPTPATVPNGSNTPTTTAAPTGLEDPTLPAREAIGAESIRGNLAECAGVGAFADLVIGAPVVVSDDAGKAVGVGKILFAVGTNVYQGRINQCTFRFSVFRMPHLPFYNVKVASQKPQRVPAAALQYTRGFIQLRAYR